jgi:hypothetical protein
MSVVSSECSLPWTLPPNSFSAAVDIFSRCLLPERQIRLSDLTTRWQDFYCRFIFVAPNIFKGLSGRLLLVAVLVAVLLSLLLFLLPTPQSPKNGYHSTLEVKSLGRPGSANAIDMRLESRVRKLQQGHKIHGVSLEFRWPKSRRFNNMIWRHRDDDASNMM